MKDGGIVYSIIFRLVGRRNLTCWHFFSSMVKNKFVISILLENKRISQLIVSFTKNALCLNLKYLICC